MNIYHENQVPWPATRPLTKTRKNGPFKTSLANACDRIEQAVKAFTKSGQSWRTKELWIYTEGKLGARNRFLSNQSSAIDARVAVRFDLDGVEFCILADRYWEPEQNLAGIAAYIESVRAQERNGIFTVAEMMHTFAALPAPQSADYFAGCAARSEIESRYRDLAKTHHPDVGGDPAVMSEINAQKDERIRELTNA